jgi:Putative adhesin
MQKTFDVDGRVELDIRLAAGDIDVDATLENRVEIELIAHDEDSQRLVDAARVELSHGHRPTVLVDVPNKKAFGFVAGLGEMFGRSGITCRIRCPHESGLSVRTKSADVSARGTVGGVNVASASGDVEVDRVSGGVNVKSASGDFHAREVGSGVNVQTASGDVAIEVTRGPVNVATASGDVGIEAAYDNVSVNTVSGDQDHGAVLQGTIAANSVSGDVTIGVRRGSNVYLDCNTVSGDTTSELELTTDAPPGDGPFVEIRAKTVSGDIRIHRAPAPTDIQEVHV